MPPGKRLSLIYTGTPSREEERQLQHVLSEVGLSPETPIYRAETPVEAIPRIIRQHNIDLLIAEAFDDRRSLRHRPGRLAHVLLREAPSSLLFITEPHVPPEPIRRIVTVTDDSAYALRAFRKVIRFAEREGAECVYVLHVLPKPGEAAVLSEDHRLPAAIRPPVFASEHAFLRDFVDAVGYGAVPIEPVCLTGPTGFTTIQFAQRRKADLLALPPSSPLSRCCERVFPSEMAWSLPEVPCTLWVMQEGEAVQCASRAGVN